MGPNVKINLFSLMCRESLRSHLLERNYKLMRKFLPDGLITSQLIQMEKITLGKSPKNDSRN